MISKISAMQHCSIYFTSVGFTTQILRWNKVHLQSDLWHQLRQPKHITVFRQQHLLLILAVILQQVKLILKRKLKKNKKKKKSWNKGQAVCSKYSLLQHLRDTQNQLIATDLVIRRWALNLSLFSLVGMRLSFLSEFIYFSPSIRLKYLETEIIFSSLCSYSF